MYADIKIWTNLGDDEKAAVLQRPFVHSADRVNDKVRRIIDAVRRGGDQSVQELTREFDNVEIGTTLVGGEEFAWAENQLTEVQLASIDLAISNVRRFHEAQIPPSTSIEIGPGVKCERICHAIERVGLYVPAGSAPLPSTAIMLGVPAALAGCPVRIMCTPPRTDGRADPAVLVAARRSGTERVYKIGGAQAIAAMAFGTGNIPKTDKIFGPGNAWVTAAKTLVSNDPEGAAIDMPAGPSEVLVIADESANASFVAADLLSQAEHGPDSQVILLTTSELLAAKVAKDIQMQLQSLDRKSIAEQALSGSSFVVVPSLEQAVEISNRYAPEHLIIQTNNPRQLLADIRNAGSVFLGPWSPEAAGDYCSGTNHVLPTYGHSRSYSGLSVDQFMRQMTVQELTKNGLQSIAPAIRELAVLEGLDAHARAVQVRFDDVESLS